MTFREHFQIPENLVYLNTPGNGLLPTKTIEWRAQWEKTFYAPETYLRDQQPVFIQETKKTLASFFNTDSKNVFCTPNFSHAFIALLELLPEDYTYLILNEDYPSLNFPIINRKRQHNLLQITETLEEDLFQKIVACNPDVLVLSIVQYITGVKIDIQFIEKLKSTFPNLIIIGDGTQYFGTEPFDFDNSGFDAVAGSGYKWLLSGFGNGFILVNEQLQELLVQNLGHFQYPKQMWADKSKLQTFFEPGHQDTLAHGTLNESLSLLLNLGLTNIQTHITDLTNFTYEKLHERNMLLPIIRKRSTRSALINIQLNPELYPELVRTGIRCFPRGSGIRIGIHLYNTQEDVQYLVDIIDTLNK